MRSLDWAHPVERIRLRRVRLERHVPRPCGRCQRGPHPRLSFEDERPSEQEITPEAVNSQEELALRLDCVVERRHEQPEAASLLPL